MDIASQQYPHKTVRAVLEHYTNLTQPTVLGSGLGWSGFYHRPVYRARGGMIHQGLSDSVQPERRQRASRGGEMFIQTQPTILPRTHIVTALTTLRQEWQDAVPGQSLLQVNASVGMLLADVVFALGLTPVEQVQAFGPELAHEIEAAMTTIVKRKNGKR